MSPTVLVPGQLWVPDVAWTREYDVVVVGSGAAGLSTALAAAAGGRRVLVITKGRGPDGSTNQAQGGLAAVLDPTDSLAAHVQDTLVAGAGHADPAAVRTLVAQAPGAITRLEALGARFDRDETGARALTREGGHSARRIVHAGGDASGAEVSRALLAAVRRSPVAVLEHGVALDALRDGDGRVVGVRVLRTDADGVGRDVGDVLARAVVLATGGIGQAFGVTTNPGVVTGDGVALALRAGAVVTDVEFMQFHPTALWAPGRLPAGGTALGEPDTPGEPAFLISEAVRGEGGVLVDATGARVMAGVHPLADLAPRDVVAATMNARMREAPGGVDDHLWLDATGLGASVLERRFPTIVAACRAVGIDPVTDPIPVAPAAHYFCGGVRADMDGRTTVPGLYAVGEVACTGVQGANRLASNSITEGLVTGERLGRALAVRLPAPGGEPVVVTPPVTPATPFAGGPRAAGGPPAPPEEAPAGARRPFWAVDPASRARTAVLTARYAGVLREPGDLVALTHHLAQVAPDPAPSPGRSAAGRPALPSRAEVEATNLHTVTTLVATAALTRTESRGCHRRADVTTPRPEWAGTRIALTLGPRRRDGLTSLTVDVEHAGRGRGRDERDEAVA